uniref:Myb-like domain-containing protein n=1 Tax=Davidia involucrata TaxID=16924 RepID=A0A5B6Z563_DAVIN
MSAPPQPPRKFPAPCWTQEETLALIDAYRERWYALRRGYLRTADWNAVADTVGSRCPNATPSKTSAQCRHKMEKLRQRYRTEKQRSHSYPGRFFSSWVFFENMDSMENGPSAAVGSDQNTDNRVDSGSGDQVKTLTDRNLVPLRFKSKNSKNIDGRRNTSLGFDHDGGDPGGGLRVKNIGDRNSVTLEFRAENCSKIDGNSNPNFGSRFLNGYPSYMDDGSDQDADDGIDFGGGFLVKNPIDGNLVLPVLRGKKFSKIYGSLKPNLDSNHIVDDGEGGGFHIKNLTDQNSVPPRFRPKKFGKVDGKLNPNFECDGTAYDGVDADGGFSVKILPGFRAKNSRNNGRSSDPNLDSRILNGFSSARFGLGKKSDRGVKRERGLVTEMVSSIKLLGEGFVKMEKMKMEMAREIEQMRMEMEMKRNELMLESQQQIVDAFVKVLLENKKQKTKTTVSPES